MLPPLSEGVCDLMVSDEEEAFAAKLERSMSPGTLHGAAPPVALALREAAEAPAVEEAVGWSEEDAVREMKRQYRQAKIERWLVKRKSRNFKAKATYETRVAAAQRRPRAKGKFAKQTFKWVPASSAAATFVDG